MLSVVFGFVSVAAALIYWVLDNRAAATYDIGQAGETDKIVLGELFQFGRSFWYVVLLCVV